VIAGGGSRLRVHIHTNEPRRLMAALAEVGTVERTKIDDMVLQQLAAREATLALVTDSSCDMPEASSHAIGLVRVPFAISFGEEEFLDGVDITPPQFYRRLATTKEVPRTSQPAVGDFRATFRRLLENHEGVISLHVSAGLSGTYQAALAAARQVDGDRIRVVDTCQVSVGLGLVAEAVGEAIAAGRSLDEAAAIAKAVSREVKLFASFATLDLAVRGGRLSASQARVATVFGLNPLLTVGEDGKAAKAGVCFGFAASLRGIVKRVGSWADGRPVRLMVTHASAVGAAEYVAERLCSRFGVTDIPIVDLTAVLACHVGPGAVAVAVRRMEG
jgi:DegV family protein with EDD domain